MPTEYAEACFRCTLMPGFNVFGIFICPTINFWPYIAILKTYYTPIRPLTRALLEDSIEYLTEYSNKTKSSYLSK